LIAVIAAAAAESFVRSYAVFWVVIQQKGDANKCFRSFGFYQRADRFSGGGGGGGGGVVMMDRVLLHAIVDKIPGGPRVCARLIAVSIEVPHVEHAHGLIPGKVFGAQVGGIIHVIPYGVSAVARASSTTGRTSVSSGSLGGGVCDVITAGGAVTTSALERMIKT